MCKWVFNKGQVECSWCPREFLQARKGNKQTFIEWDDGIAIYYPITVDRTKSGEGWSAALDFNAEIEGLDGNTTIRWRRSDAAAYMATAALITEEMMNEHFERSRRDTEERERAKRHASDVSDVEASDEPVVGSIPERSIIK